MLQSWAVAKDGIEKPAVAELEVIRVALVVAQQSGWRKIEIQVDIKAIAECLQSRKSPVLEATIIAEDTFLLAMMFVLFSVNRFCYQLACMTHKNHLMQSWKCNFPLWMLKAAAEDLRSFDQL